MKKKELLTVSQYAKKLGVTRDTIYKRIKRGDLPKGVSIKEIADKKFLSVVGD